MATPLILLNDFKRQWDEIRTDVLAAVERVGQSGWYVLGESVQQFEHTLARSLSRAFAVGCASGLDAIEISLRALKLPPGAPVLTTPLTAFATTLAIVRAGGVPVYADVDARGNLDLDRCENILATRKDISFLLPVHLYGHPLDLQHLADLKERFGLVVVEDCAQAINARYADQLVGTVGDLAALSFYPTKNLGALGDGGAVLGNEETLCEACRSLRNYGQSARYVHSRLGLNSRLDELHAAVLESALLPRLARWTERRRHIAARYLEGISNPQIATFPRALDALPAWHLFPVLAPAGQRGNFQRHLELSGVQTAVHYPTLTNQQEALREAAHEILDPLARASEIASREVSLPIHPQMTDEEVERVISVVNSWVN